MSLLDKGTNIACIYEMVICQLFHTCFSRVWLYFCRKAIQAARYRVMSSALTTGLLTMHHTGVLCDSLGSMKACRMRQRQFVFSADPKRMRTPSIFATDFCVRLA